MLSPVKKKKSSTPTKMKSKGAPTLYAVGFAGGISIEAYFFEKPNGDESFTYGYKKYFRDGDESSDDLKDGNFVGYTDRRKANTDNEKMPVSANSEYSRTLMTRYAPSNESTPETRQEGLRFLSNFLKDGRYSDYPPRVIETQDITNVEDFPSLDEYFMDDKIKEILIEDLEEEMVNSQFYEKFKDFALKVWKHDHYSEWAKNVLGYPANP